MMRNKLFDWEVLQSKSFDIPIISVGNLAVGGTGKTPHTEYLIKFLCNQYKVAVLSRGYKRHTKGYVLATPESTARSIGDEPYQMHQKFPSVTVAVDEKRCHGIEKLLALQKPSIDVILLDDAFQHRYVKPGLSILLTDYHRYSVMTLCSPQDGFVNQLAGRIGRKSLLSPNARKTSSPLIITLSRNG